MEERTDSTAPSHRGRGQHGAAFRAQHNPLPLLLAVGLTLFLVVGGFVIALDLQAARHSFSEKSQNLLRFVSNRIGTNESVLEGFAAMIGATQELDRPRIRTYARRMLERYPHIFMFEVAETIPREELDAFVSEQRSSVRPDFQVKAFGFGGERDWLPLKAKPTYTPIVFMEPLLPGSEPILGLDLDSNAFFARSLKRSVRLGQAVATVPFRLYEGQMAYLLHRPVDQASNGGRSLPRYAMLVIEAKTLLSSRWSQPRGARTLLYHCDFDRDDERGHLEELDRNGSATLERWLFPKLVSEHRLNSDAQPFAVYRERQLGFGDISWTLLGIIAVATLIGFWTVLVYARAYHRAQLERLNAADRLFYMANHDPLTGLANRNLLADRLQHALGQARRGPGKLAVLFIDLDGFKRINDEYGHDGGDKILRQVAERLQACSRHGDTLARRGGDEFVVVVENIGDRAELGAIVSKLQAAFAQPFSIDGDDIPITASVGMALYPDHGKTAQELLSAADQAMYGEKSRR